MLAQHAIAPAVDRRYGRLVHPLGRHLQFARLRWPAFARVVEAKLAQKFVNLGIRPPVVGAEVARGLIEPFADTAAQLLGRGVGKGDDKDFRRRQGTMECGAAALFIARAVAKDKSQVERRDRVGLAGAGAGLDQAAAMERKVQRFELGGAHTGSPAGSASPFFLLKVAS